MLLIITGFFAGILSGMGVGGGMILIPALRFLSDASQHTAQAVNLFFFIPSAIGALIVHIKNKTINFRAAFPMIASGIPLAVIGAKLALLLPHRILGKIFAVFIFVFGVSEIFGAFKNYKKNR